MRQVSCLLLAALSSPLTAAATDAAAAIGQERAIAHHLQDVDEYRLPLDELLAHGAKLFSANWTVQDGGGRPHSKGTGAPLSDPGAPLTFPRAFNRVSAPDASACAGCHNTPFGIAGGGGDFVAGVFVLAQRFDFATFDGLDPIPGRGTVNERGDAETLQSIGNYRASLGMFGSGYIEMLARQMTADLQALRDATPPGGVRDLITKGVSFGRIRRGADGSWYTSEVEGLAAPSTDTANGTRPPTLVIRPFHQAGAVASLRQFSNQAFMHHHGIESVERVGAVDADGDGVSHELTRADVTAVTLFQATLPVPGRVIPRHPAVAAAVWRGEQLFQDVGCGSCHRPTLPLDDHGWIFTEPGPYNPPGNLQPGQAPPLAVDLNDRRLPGPRLRARAGVVQVPAFTDLKLHDISSGADDPGNEPLDMNAAPGTDAFFAGNRRFLTRKLWGSANEPPYFHHGQFTTLREAVLAHAGEAIDSRIAFEALHEHERDAVIEFLKSLQVLPPGALALVVDEHGRPRPWPPEAP